MYRTTVCSCLLCAAACLCAAAAGQESGPPAESEAGIVDTASWLDAANSYHLSLASDRDRTFELLPRPLLTWSNPLRSTAAGALYLFTDDGRPAAALCIYPANGALDYEFQSLAAERLVAVQDGHTVWAPLEAGIEMETFGAVTPPGESQPLRLRQMRNLARRFEAQIAKPNDAPKPLRLLSSPLYRYASSEASGKVIDGALFAMVHTTDPEVLLLIEARKDSSGKMRWVYGLGRMSMVPLRVTLEGNEVWTTEWARQSPNTPYFTLQVR